MTFDLIDGPWIPVRAGGGVVQEVGIGEALLRAKDFTRIESASPVVTASLHRLLLAVLHRALEGPDSYLDAAAWMEAAAFPTVQIRTYLDGYRDRFDLFSDAAPFYQVAGFEKGPSPVSRLAFDLTSGTNKLLFDHTTDGDPPAWTPAEAGRSLVARQMLAVPEGAGYSPSPVGGAALVIVQGNDLHETLCLNLVAYSRAERAVDTPVWEEPPLEAAGLEKGTRPDIGHTRRYTWMSRFLRLEPESTPEGVRVRWVHYAAGFKPEPSSVPQPDAMVALRPTKGGFRHLAFRSGRTLWRDLHALLPARSEGGAPEPLVVRHAIEVLDDVGRGEEPIRTLIAGAANDQAKILLWRQESVRLPAAVEADRGMREQVEEAVEKAVEVEKALYAALARMADRLLARSGNAPDPSAVRSLVQHLGGTGPYWVSLGPVFEERVLQGMNLHDPEPFLPWKAALRDAARHALRDAQLLVGSDGWSLRAVAESDAILARKLEANKEAA